MNSKHYKKLTQQLYVNIFKEIEHKYNVFNALFVIFEEILLKNGN